MFYSVLLRLLRNLECKHLMWETQHNIAMFIQFCPQLRTQNHTMSLCKSPIQFNFPQYLRLQNIGTHNLVYRYANMEGNETAICKFSLYVRLRAPISLLRKFCPSLGSRVPLTFIGSIFSGEIKKSFRVFESPKETPLVPLPLCSDGCFGTYNYSAVRDASELNSSRLAR